MARSRASSDRSNCSRRTTRRRAGVAAIYVVIIASALFAFCSLAMDYGRVQLSKTELRIMTDNAARYGVKWVSGGKNKALDYASSAAADNNVNGSAVSLVSSNLDVGNWNTTTRVFTPNIKPQNAVRLVTSAQVPLAWGTLIGRDTCTVRASTVAKCMPVGIVGLNYVDFKNNTYIGSYDPSVLTNPTQATDNANASLASNGSIGANNNGDIAGDVYIGPAGTVATGWSISGGTSSLTSAIAVPSEPAWTPTGNPGGALAAYVNNTDNATLPGGTYWFTSFATANNKSLSFTGPATLYVNGDIDLGGDLTPYQSQPSNLKIYQIGSPRTFTGGATIIAHIVAPRADFTTKNNFKLCGTCIFQSITVKNNGEFFFDETAGIVEALAIVQ
jgi:Flp pilus assembly protein TadG